MKDKNSEIPFAHLHLHTDYSLLDGAIRIKDMFKKASEFGMKHAAITDHGVMFGALEFYNEAKKAGINPIIGCECYIASGKMENKTPADKKSFHLVLLAKNNIGYKNLCKLSSAAHIKGFYYKPRIDKDILIEHTEGLIALSACLKGEIPAKLADGDIEGADEIAKFYMKIFKEGDFFLEVQNNGVKLQEKINAALFQMGKRLSLPVVATNDCHYLTKEDVKAHDALICIQTGKKVNDTARLKFDTDQLYFKSPLEMREYFADHPEALENTVKIAEQCDVDLKFKKYHFPKFEVKGKNESIEDIFEKKVRAGFENIFLRIRGKNPDVDTDLYEKRLDYEISVIKNMGFSGYFLIVSDIIGYAKNNGIPVGPGRGSAAGSLVAYSLGITGLDPLEYGLIFERFLNPGRISMPDIDVDFCIEGRENVFKYVVKKYGGEDYVAQITTFGRLKAKAVIRDVGRVLDIPLSKVDSIAKLIPDTLNITIKQALKQEQRLAKLIKDEEKIAELFDISQRLEGLARHASTHAAGVVISDKPIIEYLPLIKGKKGEVATQFEMKAVEKIGLVKFDFLGLRNLTVIENTLDLIRKSGELPPDVLNLDLSDQKTYELLSKGDTNGVFQLVSSGMKDLLVKLKPSCFDDIIALVALYRPGPIESGMIDDYVDRKHGKKKVEYLIPQLEKILKETYGVIVYQEQVMKIASEIAKYSMEEADDLRKAMGKKMSHIMSKHKERFVNGAMENSIDQSKALKLFDVIEKFGGYGFNKSHSAAYALIAFQTAYLKAHFPLEFMASLLTSEMNSTDSIAKYIAECKFHDIKILPPDINEGSKEFNVEKNAIRFGLVAVKNVGESAIDKICKERKKNGAFLSIYDFTKRVSSGKVNKRVVESLIKCGAFDSTNHKRSQMMAVLDDAIDRGQRAQKDKKSPQKGLFDENVEKELEVIPDMPNIEELNEKEILKFEKEILGFYLSGNPLDAYANILKEFTTRDTESISKSPAGSIERIGGIIIDTKTILTKKGEQMAFIVLEDFQGTIEITIFNSVYTVAVDLLQKDTPVIIQGKVEKDKNSVKILADSVIHIKKAEEILTRSISFTIHNNGTDKEKLIKLKNILTRYPGKSKVFLKINIDEVSETTISLPETLTVKPCAELNEEARHLFGYNPITIGIN